MEIRLTLNDKRAFIKNTRLVKRRALAKNVAAISQKASEIYLTMIRFKIPMTAFLLQVAIIFGKGRIFVETSPVFTPLLYLSSILFCFQIVAKPLLLHLASVSCSDTKIKRLEIFSRDSDTLGSRFVGTLVNVIVLTTFMGERFWEVIFRFIVSFIFLRYFPYVYSGLILNLCFHAKQMFGDFREIRTISRIVKLSVAQSLSQFRSGYDNITLSSFQSKHGKKQMKTFSQQTKRGKFR
jgi:hypothetical protein